MQSSLVSKDYTLQEAFGSEFPDHIKIQGFEASECDYIPSATQGWTWDRSTLRDLVAWWAEGGTDPVYLFGHTGAGKSSALRNFCAALKIPFYPRQVTEDLEFAEVLSTTDLIDGTTVTSYGLLPRAMGVEGYPGVFVADDVDRARPGFLSGFYEVLEGQPIVTNVGGVDVVKPEPGFRFAATGNTTLGGDRTGIYVGAKAQDVAFQDRFWKLEANYLAPELESKLLASMAPGLGIQVTDAMVEVANELRAAFVGNSGADGALPFPMSTRSLVRWAKMAFIYRDASQSGSSPVYYALERAFLNAFKDEPGVRLAIVKIVEGKLGPNPGANSV